MHNYVTTILVDDEPNCIATLETMLGQKFPDIKIVATCSSVAEAQHAVKKHHPNLIFLDVEMPHQNGFELLLKIPQIDFDVIFTTAYEKYALKALKLNALDYLLKPFSIHELSAAVIKFLDKRKSASMPNSALDIFIQNMQAPQYNHRKIALPTMNGLEFVYIKDIIRCESMGNYTKVFFVNKTNQLVSKSLKEFEYLLEELNFFRVHYSHLINLEHLQSYIQGEGGFALMSDGTHVEISRRRKAEFLKRASRV